MIQAESGLVAIDPKGQIEESWKEECLLKFGEFLGLPTVGFEEQILSLVKKITASSFNGKGKGSQVMTKFERELKKLEWNVKEKEGKSLGCPTKGVRVSDKVNQ